MCRFVMSMFDNTNMHTCLFFFCYIDIFSCYIHIVGSWWTHPWFTWYKHYPLGCRDIDFFVCTPDTRETPANRRKIRLFAESCVWLTHRFCKYTHAWHTAFFQPICAKKRANAVKTRENAVGSAVRCESGRAFDALPFSRLKIDPWKCSRNPLYNCR